MKGFGFHQLRFLQLKMALIQNYSVGRVQTPTLSMIIKRDDEMANFKKEKVTKPDLLFDLTTLQRECNKYFGYSAKQTLDYAQSLYEKKLITYPRTDSRCLTEDMITSTVNNILGKNDFDTGRIKVVFNSKKVTDHH